MELKDFISNALTDIAQGTEQANQNSGHIFKIIELESTLPAYITFDVAVSTSDEAGAKAGIFVLNFGASAEGKVKNENVSRIHFQVCYGGKKESTQVIEKAEEVKK